MALEAKEILRILAKTLEKTADAMEEESQGGKTVTVGEVTQIAADTAIGVAKEFMD